MPDSAAGSGSAETALRAYLDRIGLREPEIQAWAWLERDRALAAAQGADRSDAVGLLHGRAVGIKDVIDTADMPTAYGSPIYHGHRPAADAACVAALRNAGAIILGKTATTEFATVHAAQTRNPHDPNRTPGGSSSGSAAAVSDGMVWAALGTQTAGSIIRPASFCGVVGYKPSFGTIRRTGMKPLSEFTDTIGVFARNVADAALLVRVMGERAELWPLGPAPEKPRLALCCTPFWDRAEPAAQEALLRAADLLRNAGAHVAHTELPLPFAGLNEAGMAILIREARQGFAHELRTAPDLVSAGLRELLAPDDPDDPGPYDGGRALAVSCRDQLDAAVFSHHDAILTLSAPSEAPVGLVSTGSPAFNHPWTLLHGPCVNVPGLTGPAAMPIGVQLVGPRGGDAALLRIAHWAHGVIGVGS